MGKKNKSQAQRYAEMLAEAQLEGKRRLAALSLKRVNNDIYYDASTGAEYDGAEYDYYRDAVVTFSTGDTTSYTLTGVDQADWIVRAKPSEPSLPADNIFNRVLDVDWEE